MAGHIRPAGRTFPTPDLEVVNRGAVACVSVCVGCHQSLVHLYQCILKHIKRFHATIRESNKGILKFTGGTCCFTQRTCFHFILLLFYSESSGQIHCKLSVKLFLTFVWLKCLKILSWLTGPPTATWVRFSAWAKSTIKSTTVISRIYAALWINRKPLIYV